MDRQLNLRSRREPQAGEPFVVSVLSGKGGVGKSIISLNLAERASSMGFRTLLVDADFTSGNLHILSNTGSNRGLRRFAQKEATLDKLVRPLTPTLDLLTSGSGQPLEEFEDIKLVGQMARRLRESAHEYDVVVIDHASGVSKAATVIGAVSDTNLLVVIPELTSISDCYGLCKYLYSTYDQIDCRLVINRVNSEEESEYVRTKFSAVARRFLGRSPAYAGSVVEDTAVKLAVARQQPMAHAAPDSDVCQSLTSIARDLFGEPKQDSNGAEKAPLQKININPATAEIRE